MQLEWDPERARPNVANHGVSVTLAQRLEEDPLHVVVFDRFEDGEPRCHAVGVAAAVTMLVVVHTHPDALDEDRIRIIGVRKATPRERRRYEQETL